MYPILFSAEMVRAIQAGLKTETRRVISPQPLSWNPNVIGAEMAPGRFRGAASFLASCPYGGPDSVLWVREAWRVPAAFDSVAPSALPPGTHPWYEADGLAPAGFGRLRPSIHMPTALARLHLKVTDVRVERVQDIDNNGADAEGTTDLRTMENNWDLRDCFRVLWDSLNAKRGMGWEVNPWVWVIRFRPFNLVTCRRCGIPLSLHREHYADGHVVKTLTCPLCGMQRPWREYQ